MDTSILSNTTFSASLYIMQLANSLTRKPRYGEKLRLMSRYRGFSFILGENFRLMSCYFAR